MKLYVTFRELKNVQEDIELLVVELPRTVDKKTLKDFDPPVTANTVKFLYENLEAVFSNYDTIEFDNELFDFFARYGYVFSIKKPPDNVQIEKISAIEETAPTSKKKSKK